MSKNTNISELINYISVNGSGDIVMTGNLIMPGGAQAATQTYVTTAISNLVASSPATLDTLNELALALGSDPNFATTVATSIGTKQAQLNGTGFVKVTGTTVSYDNSTYLTTSIAGTTYVPYTGATADLVLAANKLKANSVYAEGSGGTGGALQIKQYATAAINEIGYSSIGTLTSGVFYFTSSASVPNFKNFVLNPSGLTDNTLRTYTLPDASGTLALTSDIPSVSGVYLPLAGGTLTGPLNGTSASFSGAASVINTFNLYKTGGTTLGGQLAYDSAVNQLYLWNNISSGYFSIYTNSVERLKILSTGNIGVNTPTPLEILSITGNVHIAGVGNSLLFDTDASGRSISQYVSNLYEFHILNSRGNSSRFILGNGSISLGTSSTPQFFINTTTGNIGIGLSNPQAILDVSHTAGTTNIIRVSNGAGNYRWRVDQGFSMIMTNASGVDTYSVNTSGGSIQKETAEVKRSGDGDLFIGRFSSGSAKLVYAYQAGSDGYLELRTGADAIVTKLSGYSGTPAYMNTKLTVGGSTTYSLSTLNVEGAIKANRSIYNWYQESYVGNSTYLHIKTNMWAGGSPNGNSDYTMSLFKGYMYAYGTPPALEGTIVFHNWDGAFYNIGTTGNLFVTAYKSTDGYVVLVTNSGSGEAGLTIDWHQAYGYPFRDRVRTASKLYGSTTGGY